MGRVIKFPSIEQYRHVIRNVENKAQNIGYDHENDHPITDKFAPKPTLKFHGTVKCHGSNAAISLSPEGDITFQSRNNTITSEADNAGFARYMTEIVTKEIIKERILFSLLLDYCVEVHEKPLTIFGEWCGGSIQKNIGLNALEKMFVVFAIRIGEDDDSIWVDIKKHKDLLYLPEYRIFNTEMFPTFDIEIDFENPKASQQTLVDITLAVEEECPVAKYFGATGVGEGLVWRCVEEGYSSSKYVFKVKGEKHAKGSKVKKLANVDPLVLESTTKFIEEVVTESRLNQGLDYLKEQGMEVSQKSTGPYLKWFFSDVMKEEHDTLAASGLKPKDVSSGISKKAREWFFKYLDTEAGL